MNFTERVIGEKAVYLGSEGPSLCSFLESNLDIDVFVFLHFNKNVRVTSEVWDETWAVFIKLCQHKDKMVATLYYDALGQAQPLEKAYISRYRDGRIVVEDVLEHRNFLATKCVAQYGEAVIDRASVLSGKPQ